MLNREEIKQLIEEKKLVGKYSGNREQVQKR